MTHFPLIRRHLAVIALAAVIFAVQGPGFVRHPRDRVADAGDSILNTWILAWDAHALADPAVSVWDAPIFYPVKNTFAFSETMFGNLWVTLPVQYLTGNPVLAFNALVFVSFMLSMYCTFLLVGRLTGSFLAGVVAGVLFSFNPFRWSEIPHVQLLPFFWAPLALGCAHRFLEHRRLRSLVGLWLALVAQVYTSIYLGLILFLTLLVFAGVYLLRERRGHERWQWLADRRVLLPVFAGAVLGGLAVLPIALPYLRSVHDWDFVRSESENATNSCEILSLLVPNGSFWTYRWWHDRLGSRIRGSYGLGLLPGTLAGAALILARRDRVVHRFAWTALVLAVFMLGPYLILFNSKYDIPLPYLLVYHVVPGAKAMRVPARYVFPLLLCLAVLAGFAVAHLAAIARRWRPVYRVALAVGGVVLLGFDYAVADDPGVRLETREHFPPVYDYLARTRAGKPVLELPANWQQQFRYLYYQTAHWRPLLGGETGSYPPAILEMTRRTQGSPTEDVLRFVALTPAQTVVIHLDRYDATAAAAWERAELSGFGFRNAGRYGDALVWEREGSPGDTSRGLRTVRTILEPSRGFFQDALNVSVLVTPAEHGRAWRYLERGISTVEVVLTDAAGKEHWYEKAIDVPPYLPAGETASVKLGRLRGAPKEFRRLQIRGPLIDTYVEEPFRFSDASEKR
jgi:hypothetical protein